VDFYQQSSLGRLTGSRSHLDYRTTPINSWSTTFPDIGSSSSVRLTDLIGDGVLDVVLGTGRQELQATDTGVVELDLIYCEVQVDPNNSDLPRELTIHRLEKQIILPSVVKWGCYKGSNYDGIFRSRTPNL